MLDEKTKNEVITVLHEVQAKTDATPFESLVWLGPAVIYHFIHSNVL